MADDWKRRSVLKSCAISRTRRWNGSCGIGREKEAAAERSSPRRARLADEQLRALLVLADLAQRHGARAVAVRLRRAVSALELANASRPRLLHASGGGRRLARSLGGQLLAGRLAARGLAASRGASARESALFPAFHAPGRLLGASHGWSVCVVTGTVGRARAFVGVHRPAETTRGDAREQAPLLTRACSSHARLVAALSLCP